VIEILERAAEVFFLIGDQRRISETVRRRYDIAYHRVPSVQRSSEAGFYHFSLGFEGTVFRCSYSCPMFFQQFAQSLQRRPGLLPTLPIGFEFIQIRRTAASGVSPIRQSVQRNTNESRLPRRPKPPSRKEANSLLIRKFNLCDSRPYRRILRALSKSCVADIEEPPEKKS
jgi:hypothetical protein